MNKMKKSKKDRSLKDDNDIIKKSSNGLISLEKNDRSIYGEVEEISILNQSAEVWTCELVAQWLRSNGFGKYANLIAHHHQIDGSTLLLITEFDLRQKPLEIGSLGDVKRLGRAISDLRKLESNINPQNIAKNNISRNVIINQNRQHAFQRTVENESARIGIAANLLPSKMLSGEELIARVESPDTRSKSFIKLALAFFYCSLSLLTTAFVMVVVHDRTPDMKTYPPLPDIVLDNIPLISWGFDVSEMIAVCMTAIWIVNIFFHKHRVIVMRRMSSLMGTVFLLRCITMLITSLSVPGIHLECYNKTRTNLGDKMARALHIWSRIGMSIHGVRSCGDYMFSGHTSVITLLNHFITEYTPINWHLLHTTTWVMNLFGIFFILASHEHYSIDVFIAFYISSRLFLHYHAYAYNQLVVTATDARTRMWFPLGWCIYIRRRMPRQ